MGQLNAILQAIRLGGTAALKNKTLRTAFLKFRKNPRVVEAIKKFKESKSADQLRNAKKRRDEINKIKTNKNKELVVYKGPKGPKGGKPKTGNTNKTTTTESASTKGKDLVVTKNKNKTSTTPLKIIGGGFGLAAVAAAMNKKKKKTTTDPKKDREYKKRMQKNEAYSMDDMLDSKPVNKAPKGFNAKKSSPKTGGGFGTNISFASKDVKSLRENARKLTSQIDNLSISSSEKRRLKSMYSRDKVDNRKSGFSMNTVYNKAFQEIKKKVK